MFVREIGGREGERGRKREGEGEGERPDRKGGKDGRKKEMCISSKFPDDGEADGPGPHFENHWDRLIVSSITHSTLLGGF